MEIGEDRCGFYSEEKSKNNLQTANVCAKINSIVLENDTKRFLFERRMSNPPSSNVRSIKLGLRGMHKLRSNLRS